MEKNTQNNDLDGNFIICYKKYYKSIIKYIRTKFIQDIFVVEDITHNLFLKLYEMKKHLDPDSPGIYKYFCAIARNMVFDYTRRKVRENKKLTQIHFDEVRMNREFYQDIEDFYIEGEVISTIHDTINSFPEDDKDVYIKKNFYNFNGSEILKKKEVTRYHQKRIEKEVNDKIVEKLKEFEKFEYDEPCESEDMYSDLLCEPKGVYE